MRNVISKDGTPIEFDQVGEEPAVVLMHGFPDNLHRYDRLVPWLSPSRRVVTCDFLGWGESSKPAGYPYTAANQTWDVDAVLEQLHLQQVVHELFPTSELFLVPGVHHFVQIDEPEQVARLLLSTPLGYEA